MVKPVREVSALVRRGCASSKALYLAQIPLIVDYSYATKRPCEDEALLADGTATTVPSTDRGNEEKQASRHQPNAARWEAESKIKDDATGQALSIVTPEIPNIHVPLLIVV